MAKLSPNARAKPRGWSAIIRQFYLTIVNVVKYNLQSGSAVLRIVPVGLGSRNGPRTMLEQTFIHIPGVGPKTERGLWQSGLKCWGDFSAAVRRPIPITPALRGRLETYIPRSIEAVKGGNAAFFSRLSVLGEAWRLFPEFASKCAFIDIETTGLSPVFDTITVVGLFDGRRYEVFVEGRNLDDFPSRVKKYSILVTFNGSGFDLRFLKLAFKNLQLPPIHIDLRWITRRLGCRGGLKSIEREFGICRDSSVEELNGYDATVLWSRYLRGDNQALNQLIAYNTEDVVHLKAIMEMAYDRLAKRVCGRQWNEGEMFSGVAPLPSPPKLRRRLAASQPRTLVASLLRRTHLPKVRVVGIDLAGSERRPSGWALLLRSRAKTKSIHSDDALIQETLAANPDIVSIDSPLSLPDGWNPAQQQVVDGSPIYRKCELALKRMGISVFWCLLPTMKSLTMRGMRLAQLFRERGLEVIESYPGAAQDILAIPRKGSSLEELKWGLHRAGIRGPFLTDRVTHDEVDAITSALVGLFYLADHYIALGTAREDYLIVPRSSRIHYPRLAEILAQTGLDEPTKRAVRGLKCTVDANSASFSAYTA